jgi:hypothetical protein
LSDKASASLLRRPLPGLDLDLDLDLDTVAGAKEVAAREIEVSQRNASFAFS